MVFVISQRVRDQQGLHDAADRRAARPDQQVKVVAEQTVAVKIERLALFQVGQTAQEGNKILGLEKHILAVIATIDDVVNQTVVNRSKRARHCGNLSGCGGGVN
jgi:hypothetical protein